MLPEIKKHRGTFSRHGYDNNPTLRDSLDPRVCGTKVITDPRNILHNLWYTYFWHEMINDLALSGQAIYQHAYMTKGIGDSVLLSVYSDGDFYGSHVDIDMRSIITAVLMLSFGPPKFSGGSLIVDEQEFSFKNNRLIIFPSCFEHEVTKIDNDSVEYTDQRFTLQYFCSAIPVKNKIIDESSSIE